MELTVPMKFIRFAGALALLALVMFGCLDGDPPPGEWH